MADNVVSSLAKLNKELNDFDNKLRASIGDSQALFDALSKGAEKGKEAVQNLYIELAKKVDPSKAHTMQIVMRLVDENGKKIDSDSIKKTIDEVNKTTKPVKLGLFEYDKKGLETLSEMLKMSKKKADDLYTSVLRISNASVGTTGKVGSPKTIKEADNLRTLDRISNQYNKTLETQYGWHLKNDQLLVKRLELERQIKEKEESGKTRGLQSLKKQYEDVNREVREYLAKVSNLGIAGERAMAGYRTAGLLTKSDIKQIDEERERLNLIRERNRLEQQSMQLRQNLATKELAGKLSVPYKERTVDQIEQNDKRILEIERQMQSQRINLTSETIEKIEQLERNHANALTNIRNNGEQQRMAIREQQSSRMAADAIRQQKYEENNEKRLRKERVEQSKAAFNEQSKKNKLIAENTSARIKDEERATKLIAKEREKREKAAFNEQSKKNKLIAENTSARIKDEERATKLIAKEREKREKAAFNEQSKKNKLIAENTSARIKDEERATKLIAKEREKREKAALVQQENNFKTLQHYRNEQRKLQNQIDLRTDKKGNLIGASKEQLTLMQIYNKHINDTVASMKQLESAHKGVTAAASKNTMNDRLKQVAATTKQITREQMRYKEQLERSERAARNLQTTADQLKNALVNVFGIYQIKQFASEIIKVRGEFEMAEVALRNIIGNQEKSNLIWKKTLNLAINSPLTAQQLTQYTKQLAAFRIETGKLYDTTKMLADVSVGLGVDMQRLVLAYGHTKASGFLRGMYARQFSTAGVNIYGELAKYYTDLEGKMVSFEDVYERISKKLVKFEDVEAVFEKITSEGGTFYRMQEVLSDTVQGQINKVKDAWQQALNDIGKGDTGWIRSVTNIILKIVKNWQKWVSAIEASVVGIVAFKATNIITYMFGYSKQVDIATKSTIRLSQALKNIGPWLAGNLPAMIAMAVTAGVAEFVLLGKRMNDFNKNVDDLNVSLFDSQKKIEDYNKRIEENNKILNDNAKKEDEVKKAREDNAKIVSELKSLYPELTDNLNQNYKGEVALTEQLKLKNIALQEQITLNEKIKQQSRTDDPFEKDAGQYLDEVRQTVKKAQIEQRNIKLRIMRGDYSGEELDIAKELLEISFKNPIEDFEKWNELVKKYNSRYDDAINALNKAIKDLEKSNVDFDEKNKLRTQYVNDLQKIKRKRDAIGLAQSINIETSDRKEFKKEVDRVSNAMLEDLEVMIRANEEWNKEIESNEYGNNFAKWFLNNFTIVEESIKKGEYDGYEVLRNFLIEHGKAVDELSENIWIQLLNSLLFGDERKRQLEELQAQLLKATDYATRLKLQVQIDALRRGFNVFTEPETETVNGNEDNDDKTKNYKSISTLISLLKEMNSEYEKLSKSAYGFAKSQDKVRESYKEAFSEIFGFLGMDINNADTWSKKGLADTMRDVLKKMDEGHFWGKFGKDGGKEARNQFLKALSGEDAEVDIQLSVNLREDFARDMEEMFSDYELTLELQGLNIPKDAAKDFFPDFDFTTLGQIQERMQKFYNDNIKVDESGHTFFDKDDLEVYRKWADKIDAEILKSRKEKTKQYSKFLEQEYSERAKLEMQYVSDIAFVRANVSDETQRANIEKNINDKFNKELNELNWKSFKESSFYIEMMDDLSSIPAEYMKTMLGKIEDILQHPETLSPRALKEAINARQKIIEAQMDYDQIAVMRESMREINKAMAMPDGSAESGVGGRNWKETKKNLDEEMAKKAEDLKLLEKQIEDNKDLQGQIKAVEDATEAVDIAKSKLSTTTVDALKNGKDESELYNQYKTELDDVIKKTDAFSAKKETTPEEKDENAENEKRIRELEEILPLLNDYIEARKNQKEVESTTGGAAGRKALDKGTTSTSIGGIIAEQEEEKEKIVNRISLLKKWQKSFENFNESFKKFNENAADMVNRLNSLAGAANDVYDALGGETNALTEGWKEFGNTMTNVITEALTMIPKMVESFATAGTTINAAMGIIGLIAEAVQLLLVAITAVSKLHDAGYEKEIEIQKDKIDELSDAYSRLERQIKRTFKVSEYVSDYNGMLENINAQIAAIEAQREAERDKKNSDEDAIREYNNQINDLKDQLEDLEDELRDTFGGIGKDNYRSWAEGFVSAWKDAFLETGNGLDALQKHFDEFLQEWFVKQAVMAGASSLLEPVINEINKAIDPNYEGGSRVTYNELERVKEIFGNQKELLDDFLTSMSEIGYFDNEGSLSGLAAGIQGMTEEQANILEAYWNSVRNYTASIDTNVAQIANMLGAGGANTNPMLEAIRANANNTSKILNILDSVTRGGHTKGGLAIKIIND